MSFQTSTVWDIHLTPGELTRHILTVKVYDVASVLTTSETRYVSINLPHGSVYGPFRTQVYKTPRTATSMFREFPENYSWDSDNKVYSFPLEDLRPIRSCSPIHLEVRFDAKAKPFVSSGLERFFAIDMNSWLHGPVTVKVHLPEIERRLVTWPLRMVSELKSECPYSVNSEQSTGIMRGQMHHVQDPPFPVLFISDTEAPTGQMLSFRQKNLHEMLGGFGGGYSFLIDLAKKALIAAIFKGF